MRVFSNSSLTLIALDPGLGTQGGIMRDLSLSIFDLLTRTAELAVTEDRKALASATSGALNAMVKDGMIGPDDDWIYRSIMHCMVQSGSLELTQIREDSHFPN
jgi:hypothetical protein